MAIFVKGSGWDMSNLNHQGMPGLKLEPLLKTISFNKMTDENMVNYLRLNLLDSNSEYSYQQIINALTSSSNFYLPYQGKNITALQRNYAFLTA